MTDWLAVAQARGIRAPHEELERMAQVLETLERAFEPLLREIPLETEPATEFHV